MAKQETPPTLAARVKYVRGFVPDLSMRELSRIANLSPSTVGMIERGDKKLLGSKVADKLAVAMGVTIDWLVNGNGAGPKKRVTTLHLVSGRLALPPRKRSGPKPKVPQ
jgi:transcriptional regulator with XRE-family HTH domain